VSFGDFAFFATRGSLGNSGGLGAAGGFDTLGCSCASSFFSFAQSTAHRGVGVFCLMSSCGLCRVACGRFCRGGGSFCFGLGEQCLFADLLGGAMPQLCAVLAA
jgi:hypothetical protein